MSGKVVSIKEYFAIAGRFTHRDAQIIGPELERLAHEGKSTAMDIVNAAQPKDAVLHSFFEWDDATAADLYRQEQARNMARHIAVKVVGKDGKEHATRAFHAVKVVTDVEPESEVQPALKSYVTVDAVRKDPQMASQVIDAAYRELVGWRRRHEQYRALFPIFGDIFQPVFAAIDEVSAAQGDSRAG